MRGFLLACLLNSPNSYQSALTPIKQEIVWKLAVMHSQLPVGWEVDGVSVDERCGAYAAVPWQRCGNKCSSVPSQSNTPVHGRMLIRSLIGKSFKILPDQEAYLLSHVDPELVRYPCKC